MLLFPVHTTRPLMRMSSSRLSWLLRSSMASTVAVTSSGGRVAGSPSSLREARQAGGSMWAATRGLLAAGASVAVLEPDHASNYAAADARGWPLPPQPNAARSPAPCTPPHLGPTCARRQQTQPASQDPPAHGQCAQRPKGSCDGGRTDRRRGLTGSRLATLVGVVCPEQGWPLPLPLFVEIGDVFMLACSVPARWVHSQTGRSPRMALGA
jgi:hypothetical protein